MHRKVHPGSVRRSASLVNGATQMSLGLTYFKRFRMEIGLTGRQFSARLPKGYWLVPWHNSLLETHAEVKCVSFRDELDATVFPCLADFAGCRRLMQEISRKETFVPEATWLVACGDSLNPDYCGTIQGLRSADKSGAIQNLGIVPDHRDLGLGTVLLYHALVGFQSVGLRRAFLEVTAQNEGAIRLYRRLGFRKIRTVYKVAEAAFV